jgi:hypothetical protein
MSESLPAFETEITFTIPSQTRFQSLKKTDIDAEEAESAPVEDRPLFIQRFHNDLARQRCVSANVSGVAIPLCFPSFFYLILHSHSSSRLFPICFSSWENPSAAIFEFKIKPKSIDQFEVGKEGQIGAAFLRDLAGEIERRGGNLRACL